MLTAKVIRLIRKMDSKEVSVYSKSVADRLTASVAIGGRELEGGVVFSKGLAWVDPRNSSSKLTHSTGSRLYHEFGSYHSEVSEEVAQRVLDLKAKLDSIDNKG